MAAHKFSVGQEVEFLPGRMDFNVPRGLYKVVRQLPAELNDWQYRVKNTADGHEWVMRESQLAAVAGSVPPPKSRPAGKSSKPPH